MPGRDTHRTRRDRRLQARPACSTLCPRLGLVPLTLDLAYSLDLTLLDCRIDLENVYRPLFGHDVFIDANNDLFFGVELLLVAVGRVGDLFLRVSEFDRADDPSELIDALNIGKGFLLHTVRQGLDRPAPPQRVNDI